MLKLSNPLLLQMQEAFHNLQDSTVNIYLHQLSIMNNDDDDDDNRRHNFEFGRTDSDEEFKRAEDEDAYQEQITR